MLLQWALNLSSLADRSWRQMFISSSLTLPPQQGAKHGVTNVRAWRSLRRCREVFCLLLPHPLLEESSRPERIVI